MKDLDFDELDKAVNSLIANTPGSNNSMTPVTQTQPELSMSSATPVANANSPITPVINVNLPVMPVVDASPQTTPLVNNPLTIPPVEVKPVTTVDRPSTGRFMDVVHPSSDMRTALVMPERNTTRLVSSPVPRPLITSNNLVPLTAINEPAKSSTNDNWPNFNNAPVENLVNKAEDEDDDIDKISNDITKSLEQPSNGSLDSPFLSDTKVEKRPLGAFSNEIVPSAFIPPMAPTPIPVPMVHPDNVSVAVAPDSVVTPLPAELSNDLLRIESADSTTHPEVFATKVPIVETQPAPVIPVAVPVTTTVTTTTTPISASIQQQYKEQPSTGDQHNGAIYDTKAYHKAMPSTPKKKSSWMWILWVLILLVVGAGIGAAVYFFVLPRL